MTTPASFRRRHPCCALAAFGLLMWIATLPACTPEEGGRSGAEDPLEELHELPVLREIEHVEYRLAAATVQVPDGEAEAALLDVAPDQTSLVLAVESELAGAAVPGRKRGMRSASMAASAPQAARWPQASRARPWSRAKRARARRVCGEAGWPAAWAALSVASPSPHRRQVSAGPGAAGCGLRRAGTVAGPTDAQARWAGPSGR